MRPVMRQTRADLCHPESMLKVEAAPLLVEPVGEVGPEPELELEREAGRPLEKD